ncbi:MAG: T9SS type A sorting domain-containing protein [Candidatus Cloacimonetes bacterium]|nr:T9SS type A sorting domain-containing protein [Candidatus Cloacimonadota bacterium]
MYTQKSVVLIGAIIFVALLFPITLGAQITFESTYGGTENDSGDSVQQTTDGGYIISGHTTSFGAGDYDIYLIKTDANGDPTWTKTYGGTSPDEAYSVQQTSDNGYIVAGNTMSFGPSFFSIYLLKTDSLGDTLWTKAHGWGFLTYCYSVQITSDSCYVIVGISQDYGEAPDVCLVKTDANGDILWTQSYGGDDYDWAYSVQQTSDNGYIITGFTASYGAGAYDVYLIKTDSMGDTLWTKTYGGPNDEEGFSVRETQDGGYLIAGYTESFGAGSKDVYVIKTDSIGDTLWTKVIGGSGGDEAYSIQEISEDEYIIAGYTSSFGSGNSDVYLIKIYSSGDTLWTRTFGGTGSDMGYSIQQTSDDGYIIAGQTESFGAGTMDVYLIKTDSLGNVNVTGIENQPDDIPPKIYLSQNYPNPFNPTTTIKFTTENTENAELIIYNIKGQKVKQFSIFNFQSSIVWDGTDQDHNQVSSGVYLYRIKSDDFVSETKKMILLK